MQSVARRNRDSPAGPRQRTRRSNRPVISMIGSPSSSSSDGAVEHPVGQAELVDQQVNQAQHTQRGGRRTATPTRAGWLLRIASSVPLETAGVVAGGCHAAVLGVVAASSCDQQLTRALPPIGGPLLEAAHQNAVRGRATLRAGAWSPARAPG